MSATTKAFRDHEVLAEARTAPSDPYAAVAPPDRRLRGVGLGPTTEPPKPPPFAKQRIGGVTPVRGVRANPEALAQLQQQRVNTEAQTLHAQISARLAGARPRP